MKIYTLDLSYYGSVVVVEETLENAWAKMLSSHPCAGERDISNVVETEISTDFVFSNLGDY